MEIVSLIFQILFKIILWILAIYVGFLLFVEIVVRFIRRYVHFPIPAYIANYLDNPIRRKMQPPAQVVDWIGVQKEMCVLEIGPGPGTFTFEAANRLRESGSLLATDIQPELLSTLQHRSKINNITNVKMSAASAYELPFPDGIFDVVFMVGVLGEIPDKKKALLEIKRVLKRDGVFATGEFLPDLDYPLKRTVNRWCKSAGFKMKSRNGGIIHYVLTFSAADA
jgi:ubiquinone/menaquinone biosynthesis C-methylase UbiE